MLKLKKVSKFYYNKGVVASGFSKVNLDLNLGEFVVITGESGSGKSTLLNVISGLDSYEEGEMYINGAETSHYNEKEAEEYRKKYIGNIFQTFNLVNSYTVYQNIELVLLLNGFKKRKVKQEILEIIKEVDLYKYSNTKVSKLSGGQKQRVAIARALAKKTPIIVADEPTGNLDSRSSDSVLKLLHDISKNKLVIIVTHNFEQVEKYATRVIKMHDGRILEDKTIKSIEENKNIEIEEYKNLTFFNKLRLGLRNTFNVLPKFILLLIVYLFVTSSLLLEYSSMKKQEYETSKNGYNNYFRNTSDERIIIQKFDKSVITDSDFERINNIKNVKKVIKDDLLLDITISLNDDSIYLYGNVSNLSLYSDKEKLDLGRMPENDNEIIVVGSKDDYYIGQMSEELLSKSLYISDNFDDKIINDPVTIVGIKYDDSSNLYISDTKFYVSDKVLEEIRKNINKEYSEITTEINNVINVSNPFNSLYQVRPNANVPQGKAYVSEEVQYICPKFNCKNNQLIVYVKNLYYEDQINLTINNIYTKKNYKKLTGLNDYDEKNGVIFINSDDYYNLFNKGNYQSSVFVHDVNDIESTIEKLNEMNIKGIQVSKLLVNFWQEELAFIKIIKAVFTALLSIALFFIAYFIIKLILKSRNIYYSTVRILGGSKKDTKQILDIELLVLCNLAYFIFVGFTVLVLNQIINIPYLYSMLRYLETIDFVILYVILVAMSYLITSKYSKVLFKYKAMVSYREEV